MTQQYVFKNQFAFDWYTCSGKKYGCPQNVELKHNWNHFIIVFVSVLG